MGDKNIDDGLKLPGEGGEIVSSLEGFFATFLHRFVRGNGGLTDFLAVVAIISALYAVFLPDLDMNRLGIASSTTHGVLLFVSLMFSSFFLVLFFLRILSRWFVSLRLWIGGLKTSVYNRTSALIASVEERDNVGKSFDIPVQMREFYEASFLVEVEDFREHWRAGLKLRHPNENEGRYIFHAHVDQNNQNVLQVRSNYMLGGTTISDERGIVKGVPRDRFEVKVTNEDGLIKSYINKEQVVPSLEVEKSTMARISLHAWADGGQYKVLFKDIKVKYK